VSVVDRSTYYPGMGRAVLYFVAGSVAAWMGADLLFNFLRVSDSYGRLFLY